MKPDRTDDAGLVPESPDATDPREARAAQTDSFVDRGSSQRADRAKGANANPDPLDVERLILSLERTPRPPAPIPDERASSDGGRFVAYRATGRPAQPHTELEARRQALAELSVLVNVTPVPRDPAQPEVTTAPVTPQARRRQGTALERPGGAGDVARGRHRGVNPGGMWIGATAVVAVGVFASVFALSRSHRPPRPSPTPAESIAAVARIGVVAAPSPAVQGTTRPEAPAATVPPAPPAFPSPTRAVPRRTMATPPAAAWTEVSRPKKPAFENW
jgi:hypothetical protein